MIVVIIAHCGVNILQYVHFQTCNAEWLHIGQQWEQLHGGRISDGKAYSRREMQFSASGGRCFRTYSLIFQYLVWNNCFARSEDNRNDFKCLIEYTQSKTIFSSDFSRAVIL